jgi:hypothetical protein
MANRNAMVFCGVFTMSDAVSPYIDIVEAGTSSTGKTKIWHVVNKTHDDDQPGIIRWHGAWRKYVYESGPAFYDAKCLRQIADFIERATQEHGK